MSFTPAISAGAAGAVLPWSCVCVCALGAADSASTATDVCVALPCGAVSAAPEPVPLSIGSVWAAALSEPASVMAGPAPSLEAVPWSPLTPLSSAPDCSPVPLSSALSSSSSLQTG
jgi:hypothetical protein